MRILTPIQQKLAEDNHNLIYAFMNKHHLNYDEYYGDMAEAFCIAITAFDETKGSLSTLAFHAMNNRLKNIRRCQSLPAAFLQNVYYPWMNYRLTLNLSGPFTIASPIRKPMWNVVRFITLLWRS